MINLTPEAATAVQDVLQKEEFSDHALRVFISGIG